MHTLSASLTRTILFNGRVISTYQAAGAAVQWLIIPTRTGDTGRQTSRRV